MPSSPEKLLNNGLALHRSGQLDAARDCYQQVLVDEPSHADALHLLGVVACQQGDHDEAIRLIGRAIALQADQPAYHSNLGNALQQLGRLQDAVASYHRAIGLQTDFADAYSNLGHTLRKLGRLDEAIGAFQQAMHWKPGYGDACNGLGSTLRALGRLGEAEKCFRTAISWQPNFTAGFTNLGNTLRDLGRPDEAIECYRQALVLKPEESEILSSLGNTCREDGRNDEAIEAYEHAARQEPNNLIRRLQADMLCPTVFPDVKAMEAFRNGLLDRLDKSHYKTPKLRMDHIQRVGGEPPRNLQFHGRDDRPVREAYASLFAESFPTFDLPPPKERPRVGFIVTATHERAFLRSMAGIVQRLPGDAYDVEVICHAEGAARIRGGIDCNELKITVIPASFEPAARAIAERACDVLYFWEIGTDAVNYFLPFVRLAPVQCTSWGIQVTSGIPTVDYYLSSDLTEPGGAAQHYSEQLLLMRGMPSYQRRLRGPTMTRDRASFGLSDTRHVYLCPQQLGKFHPDFDRLLAAILHRDSQGVVVVPQGRSAPDAQRLRQRWQTTIPDVEERILFVPSQRGDDYTSLLLASDVLLDPLHFGGVNTTYDALSLGKAVVTCPGEFQRGRFTLGCYRRMDYLQCVAKDHDHYVEIAISLASDPKYRSTVESELLRRSDVLFDDQQAVDEHHRCFVKLVDIARQRAV